MRGGRATKALEDAGVCRVADMFHCLRQARTWLARFETRCEAKERAGQKAQDRLEQPRGKPCRPPAVAARRCAQAAEAEWCRLGGLREQVEGLCDYVTPEGTLNTVRRATTRLAELLLAMGQSADGRALAAKLRGLERQPAFAHLPVLEAGGAGMRPEGVGPNREGELATIARQLTFRTAQCNVR